MMTIDTGGVAIDGKSIDGPDYKPYEEGVETPEEAVRIIERQFNCTLDPLALEVIELRGSQYVPRTISAGQLLPGAERETRGNIKEVLLIVGLLARFSLLALGTAALVETVQKHRRKRAEEREKRRERNRKQRKGKKREKREEKKRKKSRKNQRKKR